MHSFAMAALAVGVAAGPAQHDDYINVARTVLPGTPRNLPSIESVLGASSQAPRPPSCGGQPCPSSLNVNYLGGQVIANPKVYVIRWSSSVVIPDSGDVDGFFRTILNSPYLDWLNEYNTTSDNVGSVARSNKQIGRGTFAGDFIITPSVTGKILTQADATSQIDAVISNGNLPPESTIASLNTIYLIHFPPGQYICQLDQLIRNPTQAYDGQGHLCDGTIGNCFCASISNDPSRPLTFDTPAAANNPCCPISKG